MILARINKGSGLIIGLSRSNIAQLLEEHEPIVLSAQSHGTVIPLGLTIMIFASETDNSLITAMVKADLITDRTEFRKNAQPPNREP